MVSMRPEQAREFCEEDEDPAEVFAVFDAAERKGQLKRTGPPPEPPSMRELGDLLRRLLLEVRLRDRIMRVLRGVFASSAGRSKVN
jgi:hypothetical protein